MQSPSVQQLNLSYDTQQDRLLLKASISNEQEIRVWLTYRVTRHLFSVLNGEAHLPLSPTAPASASLLQETPSPLEATRQFAQEAEALQELETLDFDTAYQQRTPVASDQTLLATEARFVSVNDQLNSMQLVCANGMQVNMGLNKELVLAISRMLLVASKDAGWLLAAVKEPEAVSSIVLHTGIEKQVLH